MSTKQPIHMSLYAIAFWYSRNRRNGESRIEALRNAWTVTRPGYWKWNPTLVSGELTVSSWGMLCGSGMTIRSKDGETVLTSQARAEGP